MSVKFVLGSLAATIATLATVVIAANEYDKKISPFVRIAKDWDNTDGLENTKCPGKVLNTNKNYFFITSECPATTFQLFESDSESVQKPKWISDGIHEVLESYLNPLAAGEKARYAAKYATVELTLSKEARYAIKVIGTAYFEHRYKFTSEQRALLKRALVFYLKSKNN